MLETLSELKIGSGYTHISSIYYILYTNCSYNIRSTDDISSGYSSAEPVSAPLGSGLSRTSSMTNASKARAKSKRNEVGSAMYATGISEVLP